ncbi:MAG: YIP1 family protein [Bacteroidales bacterium]|nr:YIP1 family protein [Bacteroidales bacterium]
MSESTTSSFDFNAFISESKETLLNPKSYFSKMKLTGGMTEPLIKAVIYGAIAGVIVFLWSILGLGAAGAGFLGGAIGAMALVWYIVAAIIGLFVGAVILLIISSICKGNSDFEANVRVTAATMVVMPVSALLGFTTGINIYLGMIVSLAVSIYAIWMLYHGLVEALKAKPESAKIVMYVLIGLIVLFTLAGLSTRNRVNKLMKGYDTEELRDVMKDLEEDNN